MKKSKKLILIGFFLITLIAVFLHWQNNDIVVSNHVYQSAKIDKTFDGFTIVQLSDLHNKSFGSNQEVLINKVKELKPDIVVITGDIIDRSSKDFAGALTLIDGIKDSTSIYYVSGNHEAYRQDYVLLKEELIKRGVKVLDNAVETINKNTANLKIVGFIDPDFHDTFFASYVGVDYLRNELAVKKEDFSILLSHRPEYFSSYAQLDVDIIFAGHAHGGQIRLPIIGGLIAPNQGLFPKYTSGSYQEGNSTMYVSRGLGNSIFPWRIFNRPEIVVVKLKSLE